MFGINEITWPEFSKFVCLSLTTWYTLLILFGWIKSKQESDYESFEEYQSGISSLENLQPISVSSGDLPSEILPVHPAENILLPASLYEETGYDEGLAIDCFAEKNNPVLARVLTEIYHQQ